MNLCMKSTVFVLSIQYTTSVFLCTFVQIHSPKYVLFNQACLGTKNFRPKLWYENIVCNQNCTKICYCFCVHNNKMLLT
jgi:hypothetical protein